MNENSIDVFGKAMLYIYQASLENLGLKGGAAGCADGRIECGVGGRSSADTAKGQPHDAIAS